MSIYGALYLAVVIFATIVFAAGLAYFSALQAKLDRAKRATAPEGASREANHAGVAHA